MGVNIDKMKHELFTWVSAQIVSHLWIGAVRRLENVGVAGPSIVIANHSSYLDFLILGSLFEHHLDRRLHFFAKDKVFEHRLFRFYCRQFECLLVKNGQGSLETWKRAIQRLRGGHMIGVWLVMHRAADAAEDGGHEARCAGFGPGPGALHLRG